MTIIDGAPEEDIRISRENRGISAKEGYRPVTKKQDLLTKTGWRKINESDVPGLVAIVSNGQFGEMPGDAQEVKDLRQYLTERYD